MTNHVTLIKGRSITEEEVKVVADWIEMLMRSPEPRQSSLTTTIDRFRSNEDADQLEYSVGLIHREFS